MKRFFKWVGLTIAALVIVLLATAVILPLVFDPNDHKERIEQQASAELGRAVHLNGPIGWSVFPWLAIDLNDVTVANESGFQEALLMRAARASARVRVMPLLRGQIEIGTIGLSQPEVNLEVGANGRSNWDSLGGAGDGGDGGFGAELVVAGVQIDDGRINYSDRSSAVEATISGLDLSTGPIAPGEPLEAGLDFDLALPGAGFEGRLTARATIRGLLSQAALEVALDSLELVGSADGVPLIVELSEPAELDSAADTFTAPALTIESAGARLRTDVTARGLSGDMSLAGRLEAPGFNLRRWLTEALEADPGSADPDALTDFSLSADWATEGDRASLSNLVATLDDSKLSGEVSLSSLERLRGRFEIRIDRLDLDRYLPAEQATAGDEDLLAGLEFGNLTGQVSIDELKFSGMTASNLKVDIKSGAEGIDFDPITADFYGGKLASGFVVRPQEPKGSVKLRQDLTGVQAGPLFEDLLGQKVLTGLGNLTADISLDRPLAANPLASANGSVSYTFADGQLFGVNVFAIARKALVLMGRAEQAEEEDPDAKPATDFASMVLKGRITNGVLDTRELKLISPLLEMNGQLKVNLADRSLRGTIEPALLEAGGKAHGLKLGSLAGVPLPVSLSGSFDAPKIGLDPAKLLLASQRGRLDDGKSQLLDRLLGSESDQEADSKTTDEQVPEDGSRQGAAESEPEAEEESSKDRMARGLLDSLLKKRDDEEEKDATKDDQDSG